MPRPSRAQSRNYQFPRPILKRPTRYGVNGATGDRRKVRVVSPVLSPETVRRRALPNQASNASPHNFTGWNTSAPHTQAPNEFQPWRAPNVSHPVRTRLMPNYYVPPRWIVNPATSTRPRTLTPIFPYIEVPIDQCPSSVYPKNRSHTPPQRRYDTPPNPNIHVPRKWRPATPYRPAPALPDLDIPSIPDFSTPPEWCWTPATPARPTTLTPVVSYTDHPLANVHINPLTPRQPGQAFPADFADPDVKLFADPYLYNTKLSWDLRFHPFTAVAQIPNISPEKQDACGRSRSGRWCGFSWPWDRRRSPDDSIGDGTPLLRQRSLRNQNGDWDPFGSTPTVLQPPPQLQPDPRHCEHPTPSSTAAQWTYQNVELGISRSALNNPRIQKLSIGFFDIRYIHFVDRWGSIEVTKDTNTSWPLSESPPTPSGYPIQTSQVLNAIFNYFHEPLTSAEIQELLSVQGERAKAEESRMMRERRWGWREGADVLRRCDLLSEVCMFSRLYVAESIPSTPDATTRKLVLSFAANSHS